MTARTTPWDQRAARALVRPLAGTPITPNHLTALSLAAALAGAWLLARGEPAAANVGAAVFALARFLDHFDGELARLTGRESRVGYYFDYVAGAISYAALFLGAGVGLASGVLGAWAVVLGAVGAVSALVAMGLGIGLDTAGGTAARYPRLGGFELEDGIYLVAPAAWLGLLPAFLVLAAPGAAAYAAWALLCLLRERHRA